MRWILFSCDSMEAIGAFGAPHALHAKRIYTNIQVAPTQGQYASLKEGLECSHSEAGKRVMKKGLDINDVQGRLSQNLKSSNVINT